MYKGPWPIKACIHVLKVLKRIRRDVAADEAKVAEVKAEHEAFLASDEHKKWLKEWDEKDEDHNELRNDPDPKGWNLYLDALKDPTGHYLEFAQTCCTANPGAAELQAKCLDLFTAGKNTENAIEAATNIAKLHSKHPKAERAIGKFTQYLKDADVSKLKAKDQEALKELQANLLPAFEKEKTKKKEAAASMEHAHEFLKLKPKDGSIQDMVVQSLKKDKTAHTQVRLAERMHKRLLKSGAGGKAKSFWSAAQALYPESRYFSDKKAEEEK